MSVPDASEAARSLNRARWGDTVLRRAVATVLERSDQLDESQRAELRQVTEQKGCGCVMTRTGWTGEEPPEGSAPAMPQGSDAVSY